MPRPKINHFAYSSVPHSAATKPFAASESLPEYNLIGISNMKGFIVHIGALNGPSLWQTLGNGMFRQKRLHGTGLRIPSPPGETTIRQINSNSCHYSSTLES